MDFTSFPFLYIILFIYYWLCWVSADFVVFSNCDRRGPFRCRGPQASHCSGFSYCRAQTLRPSAWQLQLPGSGAQAPSCRHTGSIMPAHRLSCSGACPIFPVSDWTLSPALAGGFFTTEPGEKPYFIYFPDSYKSQNLKNLVKLHCCGQNYYWR